MLQFPADLAQIATDGRPITSGARPIVRFQPKERNKLLDDGLVYLPFPQSLSISDGASYNEVALNEFGASPEALSKLSEGDFAGAGAAAKNKLSNVSLGGIGKYLGIKATEMGALPGKELVAIATKKIVNPNTNMSFTGNTVRTYTFSFTLVSRHQADSSQIREIHKAFRKYTYAKSDTSTANVILDFPPTWEITFHDVIAGNIANDNKWIPAPYDCYLTRLGTDFNPSGPMFRYDGSPFEIGLQLEFTETRALMRTEIEEIHSKLRGTRPIKKGEL